MIISTETFLLHFKLFISVIVIYVKWVDRNEAWENYEEVNPVFVQFSIQFGLKRCTV